MNDHPTEWLSAYMDDELDMERRQLIDRHLAECSSCQELLNDLMDMQSQVAQFYHQVEAPESLERKVLESLDQTSAAAATARTGTAVIPVAGFVLLGVFAFLVFRYGSVWLKLISVLFKFMLTAAYVVSHLASSIPTVWISVAIMAVCLTLISGLSLRRIMRSSTQ